MKIFIQRYILLILFIPILIFASFHLTGCGSGSNIKYPSITETATNEYRYGQVVWRDLVTPDPEKAAKFYKKVFGWQVQEVNSGDRQYWTFKNNGKPIGGMFLMSEAASKAGGEWVSSISVASVDNTANLSKANGGSIVIKHYDMIGRGRTALIYDPQKAPFILLHSSKGDPKQSEPEENGWLWTEDWSTNPDEAGKFYKTVFNSELENKMDDNREYTFIVNNGVRSAGIIKNPMENIRSSWYRIYLCRM
ncbi:MAG: VOC family protein [Bacteroidota bacterium]|nr:VOC family protein [Bacteroidota bacterium]